MVLLVAALALVGCGRKGAERAVEKMAERSITDSGGRNAKVDIAEDSMTIETDEGTLKIAGGDAAKLPASFPKDVLVYKGAKLQTVMEVPQGYTLMLQTGDAVSKVQEAYQTKMTSEGWSKEMAMDMGAQKMLVFKKGERTVSVVLSSEDDSATQIAMTVANE